MGLRGGWGEMGRGWGEVGWGGVGWNSSVMRGSWPITLVAVGSIFFLSAAGPQLARQFLASSMPQSVSSIGHMEPLPC